MRVRGLVWLGIPTDRYAETAAFFEDVLGLDVEFDEGTTVELSTAGGDRVQLFAPGHAYHGLFRELGCAVVPLFEVDDLAAATAELKRAGVEILGPPEQDSAWTWINVRGPDGNVYELAERRPSPAG